MKQRYILKLRSETWHRFYTRDENYDTPLMSLAYEKDIKVINEMFEDFWILSPEDRFDNLKLRNSIGQPALLIAISKRNKPFITKTYEALKSIPQAFPYLITKQYAEDGWNGVSLARLLRREGTPEIENLFKSILRLPDEEYEKLAQRGEEQKLLTKREFMELKMKREVLQKNDLFRGPIMLSLYMFFASRTS